MARLWSSGFELNSLTSGVEWDTTSGSPTIQSTVVRSGSYALKVNSLSSGNIQGVSHNINRDSGPKYFRFYFRYDSLPSAETSLTQLFDSYIFNLMPVFYVTLNTSGQLTLYSTGGTSIGSSSSLSSGTWYRIEYYYDFTPASGSQIVEAKLDGTTFASSSSISTGLLPGLVRFGGNVTNDSATGGTFYFDDIAINDSTGSFQNSWPGAGSIVHLRPNATGDNNGWVDSVTLISSANNYQDVDEVAPNDATDYVRGEWHLYG